MVILMFLWIILLFKLVLPVRYIGCDGEEDCYSNLQECLGGEDHVCHLKSNYENSDNNFTLDSECKIESDETKFEFTIKNSEITITNKCEINYLDV
jgi:hypothetical protein